MWKTCPFFMFRYLLTWLRTEPELFPLGGEKDFLSLKVDEYVFTVHKEPLRAKMDIYIGEQWWQLHNSIWANIIQHNVVISAIKAPRTHFLVWKNHMRTLRKSFVTQTLHSLCCFLCIHQENMFTIKELQQTDLHKAESVTKQHTYQNGLWLACLFWCLMHTSFTSIFQLKHREMCTQWSDIFDWQLKNHVALCNQHKFN